MSAPFPAFLTSPTLVWPQLYLRGPSTHHCAGSKEVWMDQTVARMPSANGCSCVGADITSPPYLPLKFSPTRSIPLVSRSVSLCYLKPEILPFSPSHCVASVCLAACVSVRVYACVWECAKKRRQSVGDLESGDRETAGRQEASEEGERHQEWETAMKFIQAICVLLLCPVLSINSR